MITEQFLDKAAKAILDKFPNSTIEYEYKPLTSVYFVRVTPPEVFNDKEFIDLDFELTREFEELSEDEICFITTDSLVELEDPIIIHESRAIVFHSEEKEQLTFHNIPSEYLLMSCENDDCIEIQKLAA